LKGVAPIMAVEIARRVVPGHVRPSFKEVEEACRNRGSSPTSPEAAAGAEGAAGADGAESAAGAAAAG